MAAEAFLLHKTGCKFFSTVLVRKIENLKISPKELFVSKLNPNENINFCDWVNKINELIPENNKTINSELPNLRNLIPTGVNLDKVMDRSITVKASLVDVEKTLIHSVVFVILVVFIFLGNVRSTIVPGVALVLSILGTFGVMWLLDYSLNSLSLMALTIATGFVVDDAIVVLENISRYIEQGMKPKEAAL